MIDMKNPGRFLSRSSRTSRASTPQPTSDDTAEPDTRGTAAEVDATATATVPLERQVKDADGSLVVRIQILRVGSVLLCKFTMEGSGLGSARPQWPQ